MKLAAAGFVIPFVFLYNTDLLMYNPATNTFGFSGAVAVSFITAALGCMIMALALFGWFFRDLKLVERIVLLVCAVLLMLNEPFVLNVVGFAVACVILVLAKMTDKKKEEVLV
jgi:TRAP-type uncharacterized transport system fused permease subunit